MQRWGKTSAGTIRWYCPMCRRSGIKRRVDITRRFKKLLFQEWLTGSLSLKDIAKRNRITVRTLERWFLNLWIQQSPACDFPDLGVLIVDGLYLESRNNCVLIGKTKKAVIHWVFTERESYGSWMLFCRKVPAPRIVVCDGQRGMRAAIRDSWPTTRIQRCVIHIFQLSVSRLTRHPQTGAGQTLYALLYDLLSVCTRRQKRRWVRSYRKWKKKYDRFLKERTIGEQLGKKRTWWYTHKRIRSVRALVDNALPELFTYVGHPDIPRTTNHVEGGIQQQNFRTPAPPSGIFTEKERGFSIPVFVNEIIEKTNTKCLLARF